MPPPDLKLPEDLRAPLLEHIDSLRHCYSQMGWGGRTGFGKRPALVVIDLALFWTSPKRQIGTNLDSVVEATRQLLEAARQAGIPIFFTTFAFDPSTPLSPHDRKLAVNLATESEETATLFEIDPRLARHPKEKLVRKPYASAFKGTNLHEMLAALHIDTLIVTGCSTSHCVYATCRDATDSFHVIVPREAVGERCELLHEVNLLDIDIDLGDVMPIKEVLAYIDTCRAVDADR